MLPLPLLSEWRYCVAQRHTVWVCVCVCAEPPVVYRLHATLVLAVKIMHCIQCRLSSLFCVSPIFGPGSRVPKSHRSSSCCCCCYQFSKGPKIPKAVLICSGAQRNFAYSFVLTFHGIAHSIGMEESMLFRCWLIHSFVSVFNRYIAVGLQVCQHPHSAIRTGAAEALTSLIKSTLSFVHDPPVQLQSVSYYSSFSFSEILLLLLLSPRHYHYFQFLFNRQNILELIHVGQDPELHVSVCAGAVKTAQKT